jgi:hypothetical protein
VVVNNQVAQEGRATQISDVFRDKPKTTEPSRPKTTPTIIVPRAEAHQTTNSISQRDPFMRFTGDTFKVMWPDGHPIEVIPAT